MLQSRWTKTATAVVLVAAGITSGAGAATAAPVTTTTQVSTQSAHSSSVRHNGTDDAFVGMLLVHHQDAIKFARLAVQKSPTPEVRRLARTIIKGQTAQAAELRVLIRRFGTHPMPSPAPVKEFTDRQMKRLMQSSGKAFDAEFLDIQSNHHANGISMAALEIAGGVNHAARALARDSRNDQLRELKVMLDLGAR